MRRSATTVLACLAAAALAACVTTYTPDLLRSEGRQAQFKAAQAPIAAAGCIARSIENARDVWAGTTRGLPNGAQEVVIRSPISRMGGIYILFEVVPDGQGSTVTGWFNPRFVPEAGEDFVREAIKGC